MNNQVLFSCGALPVDFCWSLLLVMLNKYMFSYSYQFLTDYYVYMSGMKIILSDL